MHTDGLRYRTTTTCVGTLLMAAGDAGITHVSLGESAAVLVDALRAQAGQRPFREADAEDGDPLPAWLTALASHLDHDVPLPPLPIVTAGTPFQQRVWEALRQVPAGSTTTYRALAEAVGQPGAVRAVGSACGANRVAVLIPCHRAVRTDGGLGGFRWGLERKRALLDRERHAR
jgi:AraC family transcriptional regulator of adaptative response/methylated-DNA-[protein]-cysteine methyltransferase